MSAFAPTDLALVAPLTFSEVTRVTIEKAKRTLETPSTTKDERETAIGCLEEIYELPTTSRTSYHYGAACCLLAMYSTQDTNLRRSYAHKCLTEARKKLKKNPTTDTGPFQDEYSVSEQIFKGLQKMARLALDMIGNDVRRARAEGKLLEPKQVQTGHVKKKKKVSWGGIAAYEGDEDYDDDDDDGDDDDDDNDEEEEGETGALGDEHEDFVKVHEDEEERHEADFGEFHHDAKTMDTKWPGIIDSL